ncbi:MAG: hypothetical protein AAB971_03580, partial [Patescibacteria group bacterium]
GQAHIYIGQTAMTGEARPALLMGGFDESKDSIAAAVHKAREVPLVGVHVGFGDTSLRGINGMLHNFLPAVTVAAKSQIGWDGQVDSIACSAAGPLVLEAYDHVFGSVEDASDMPLSKFVARGILGDLALVNSAGWNNADLAKPVPDDRQKETRKRIFGLFKRIRDNNNGLLRPVNEQAEEVVGLSSTYIRNVITYIFDRNMATMTRRLVQRRQVAIGVSPDDSVFREAEVKKTLKLNGLEHLAFALGGGHVFVDSDEGVKQIEAAYAELERRRSSDFDDIDIGQVIELPVK